MRSCDAGLCLIHEAMLSAHSTDAWRVGCLPSWLRWKVISDESKNLSSPVFSLIRRFMPVSGLQLGGPIQI